MENDSHQIVYNLKGLMAPKRGKKYFDKFFFSRKPATERVAFPNTDIPAPSFDAAGRPVFDDDGYVSIKIEDIAESDVADLAKIELNKILHFYALMSRTHVPNPKNSNSRKITEEHPFGTYLSGGFLIGPVLNQEQHEEKEKELDQTMEMYNQYNQIYDQKSKQYLKNAILYFYRATEDLNRLRLEEGLIDLIIALEYLLSNESSEIRFKISSRAATILSLEADNYTTKFNEIYEAYKKRNNIIHGLKEVKLGNQEVMLLYSNVRQLIISFLKMNKSKKVILNLLEGSLIKEEGCLEELTTLFRSE